MDALPSHSQDSKAMSRVSAMNLLMLNIQHGTTSTTTTAHDYHTRQTLYISLQQARASGYHTRT